MTPTQSINSNSKIKQWPPQGYWEVCDQKFSNKYKALLYATKLNEQVYYRFFDPVWNSFDRSQLGKYSLNDLYIKRAKQLREQYDYLVLYFSGGSDSYNVLRTFLDNNIKLDEICVKWCTDVFDKDVYTPNTVDQTAYNYLSEWDYAIKPVLDEVKKSNPEIKIKIVNWLENFEISSFENIFDTVNHWHDIELPSLATWSPSEHTLPKEGKSVGGIYGVDKPNVFFESDQTYMYFTDCCAAMGSPCPNNPTGVEYFYWSPNLPELPFEMAFQTLKFFKQNESLKFTENTLNDEEISQANYQLQQKKLRHFLYNNWSDRFQTQKPELNDRTDKHSWICTLPEMKEYKDTYQRLVDSRLNMLRADLISNKHNTRLYKPIFTQGFLLPNSN